MEDLGQRINRIIRELGIKKIEFAERINVSQAFVSQLTKGVSQPSDRTIADICREFGVNEEWLLTGQGEMFRPKSRNEELSEFFLNAVEEGPSIKTALLAVMARLSEDQWALLADVARKLATEMEEEEKTHKKNGE